MKPKTIELMRQAWKDYKQLEEESFAAMRQAQESTWRAYMRQETVLRETFLAVLGRTMEEYDG